MRSVLFLVILLATSLSHGLVREDSPLISKSSGSGFVPAEYVRSETCNVFADRVLILKTYGTVKTSETRTVNTTGIQEALRKASTEKVSETANGLCDGPVSQVNAFVEGTNVILYSTGGCGTAKKHREGPFTAALMDLIANYCAKTY